MKGGCIVLMGFLTSTAIADDSLKPQGSEAGWEWLSAINTMPDGGWLPLVWASTKDSIGFISTKRYVREGAIVSIWMRWEYKAPQRYPSVVQRTQYDCSKVLTHTISQLSYSANNMEGGTPDSLILPEAQNPWRPIAPGTMGETILDFVCSIPTAKTK